MKKIWLYSLTGILLFTTLLWARGGVFGRGGSSRGGSRGSSGHSASHPSTRAPSFSRRSATFSAPTTSTGSGTRRSYSGGGGRGGYPYASAPSTTSSRTVYVTPSVDLSNYVTKGQHNFLGLSDTPSSYSGQAGKYPRVNATGTGLEFATVSGGSGTNLDYYVVDGTDYAQNETGIQSAIDDCNSAGGGVVFLPAGTYTVSSTITLKSNVKLIGASRETTKINWTGSSSDTIFELQTATESSAYSLLSDAVEYETKITLTSGAGADFSADDFIYLADTTNNYYQMNIVKSVSSDTLYLKYPNVWAFPSASTSVYRITGNTENASIENLYVYGNKSDYYLNFTYGRNIKLRNLNFQNIAVDYGVFFLKGLEISGKNITAKETETYQSFALFYLFESDFENLVSLKNDFSGLTAKECVSIFKSADIIVNKFFIYNFPELSTGGIGLTINLAKNISVSQVVVIRNNDGTTGVSKGINIDSGADYVSVAGGIIKNCDTAVANTGTNTSVVGIP